MEAISIENITKNYRNGVQALNRLSLTVQEGEIFSLLGQNGAGKSTLIRVLTTYLTPTSGKAVVLGNDLIRDVNKIRREIACVSQRTSIDTYLSLTENMMFQSRIYKIPKDEAKKRMDTLISCFNLGQYLKYPVSSYSGGVKRRLDIALNLMSNPKLLFLDEPTVGMDIQSRMAMWDMMKRIRTDFNTTIFLTTHYLEEADQLSDNICIMKDGKEVAQGTPYEMCSYLRQDMVKVMFMSEIDAEKYSKNISDNLHLKMIQTNNDYTVFNSVNSQMDVDRVARYVLEHNIPFLGIEILQPSLEDVFLRLTGCREGEAI